MSYFTPCSFSKNKIEDKLDLYNYTTKSNWKNATGLDKSQFAKKDDLAQLKSEVDKFDIDKLSELDADKLKPVAIGLSNRSDVVKNDDVKKDVYNARAKNIEDEIPDITNLATYTILNAKRNEVKDEILNNTNFTATAVESKTPNVNDLVKKADYDAEIKYIKNKYFTTFNRNKFTNNITDEKITAKKKLVNEISLNERINTLARKKEIKKFATHTELKAEQDKMVKLQTYDLSLFIGQSTLSIMEHNFT